ncbi:PVC-type heme-binding CxxCH protein [Roseiconus lacunae]|uniref:PVC-type heme-binding CxxCH protein n=1 Tax=Roseiconus lacunae TaxID=2605694 RepID=UPI003089F33D|nr:PVC-type heme-binding CxxCH protein [Stieleria sp. HD01]
MFDQRCSLYRQFVVVVGCVLPTCLSGNLSRAADLVPPLVIEDGWEIELVKAEPEIVTPVMCVCDRQGRLLVIESHTHFPADDYSGPGHDRILRFSDSDSDGTLDRREVFFDQGKFTMGLACLDDGSVVVSYRDKVIRIDDKDGDGSAEQTETLLELDTVAEYPHNGLSGLTVSHDGWLYVGQGENFGEDYVLTAKDGSKQTGGGEGGNIFRLRVDGTQLQRIATGFWNPFGLCFDSANRLWTAGNDPDAMPPCRLMHVVEGGDYGFEFRFGRGGTHPLQSWLGELPVTLPPAAATGEAPCAVVPVGADLWVASWGDNRLEAYELSPSGASWTSQTRTILQGDTLFRPVGIAVAPDQSVYLTDWVRRDYSVHQTGRIWRLKRSDGQVVTPKQPKLSPSEMAADKVASESTIGSLLDVAVSPDRYLAQAAITALAKHPDLYPPGQIAKLEPEKQLGILAAWRWREFCEPKSLHESTRQELIHAAISANDEDCNLFGLRWAAERRESSLLPIAEKILQRRSISPKLFEVAVAAISYLQNGTARSGIRDPARESLLETMARDEQRDDRLRAFAIRAIPKEAERPTVVDLKTWLKPDTSVELQSEIVRLLIARGDANSAKVLISVAKDAAYADSIRADAISGLSGHLSDHEQAIRQFADNQRLPNEVREEASRVLARQGGLKRQKRPPAEDFDSWLRLVGSGGDPAAGARVFQRSTCIRCHLHGGRGATTGPDLTSLTGQSRARILKSILDPSAEVGPLYVPWKIVTLDGDVRVGLKLPRPGVGGSIAFQSTDGLPFYVKLEEIEMHSFSDQSIMPEGLEQTMSIGELRDLLAFLETSTSQ